jgi:hypothetical protein
MRLLAASASLQQGHAAILKAATQIIALEHLMTMDRPPARTSLLAANASLRQEHVAILKAAT